MTEESAVKVCVRVRPLIAREESTASENAEPVQLFWKTDKKSIHQIDDGNSTKSFSFDRVFTAAETTNHLYQEIAKPLVVSTVEGYNGTIFAYGQTSSGKTFTMMGSDRIPGVIPLAVEDVFQTIKTCPKKEFLLRVSYMEIYNETVTDLLVDSWKRKPLEVREAINKNIYVADLTEELVTSPAQALAWIRKGEKNRHYGKTKMNQRSSRSHTIFRMILESRERSDPASGENADGVIIVSHLNLVDLAGSERASQTGAEGTRFKEGCNINRSLFTLGQVIKKLTDEGQKGFTNYRDSKLTRILQNSLGGNAKTVIICTITPVTVDETLSTLQFASTAKKMKNDPHVTEVSDDGALLKRYRNEIVDLKRRLHEVSSVTQTTATEKEVLSQLLQEKGQLQREQEDRIRNLTQLLVTSSNSVSFPKIPKRRVTWGGKMHKLARLSGCDGASSDLSFAESFSRKRKADRSCLAILGEDDEDFNWEIPDGPSDEMEMSQSSVTVRSFEESPRDFVSSERLHELSGKVSNLELQLEMESQQKEEAMTKVETLDGRVAELELQLQTEAQQKLEAMEKIQTIEQRAAELELQLQTEAQQKLEAMEKIQPTEQRAAELELQLQTEAQQKLEALEKVEMLEVRVADLDRRLEEQSCTQTETDKQMRREFAETIQLCETLASEKEMVAAERDYLKQELGMFIEQTKSLEKEKATLSKELEEKGEMDEFKSLEEEFRKEHENEMQNEISCLRKALESSELQCLELRNKLETLSEELKKKTEFAEDLQSMSGKDLVQEVAKLRRSLDDAEGLSRDTKKDWAVLRSQNIALEELNVTLTANHEKMDAEVKSLRIQLETEKSRYRKMQSDLQKELNVAFDENTKLTTLLDGKVPKNLIDSVELERTVANLNKELTASREAEGALRAQLEELASFQTLPDKIDSLMKQVCELTEELCAVETHKDSLLSAQAQCQEEAQQLRDSLQTSQDEILKTQADLSAAVLREKELSQQCVDVTQQLDSLRSNLERSDVEKSQLMATIEETGLKLEERERHMATLEEKLNEVQQLMKDLEEKLADSDAFRTTEEEISKELQERLNQLTEELQHVQAEKDALLSEQNAGAQRSAEEMENLLSTVTALTAERDQLRTDLQENVEMMIDHQEELRTALEKNRVQKEQIKQLETTQTSRRDVPPSEMSAQLEELQTHTRTLAEELESVRAERDRLLSERTANTQTHSEEVEKLLSRVTSLSEERDQLQDTLEGLRQEKQQLRAELEDRMEMVAQAQSGFTQPEKLTPELQTQDENITQLQQKVTATECLLKELQEQKQKNSDHMNLCEQKESDLEQQTRTLTEQLKSAQAERDALLFEKETSCQTSTEEVEKLLSRVTSLSEERDQLLDTLGGLRQEKQQLRAELEDRMETYESQQLLSSEPYSLKEEEEAQRLLQIQQLEEHLAKNKEDMRQLKNDLQENVELMINNQEELRVSQEKIRVLQDEISMLRSQKAELEGRATNGSDAKSTLQLQELQKQNQGLTEELESVRAERDSLLSERTANTQTHSEEVEKLLSRVMSLSEERDQLLDTLEGLRQEKQQLRAELEDRMETLQTELRILTEKLETANTQTHSEEVEKLLSRVTSLSEERDQLQDTLEGLRQEKQQLRAELEDRMETLQMEASETQELLESVQEKLCKQKQMNSDLEGRHQEKQRTLDQQLITLTEKLESVRAERDSLLSERTANTQTHSEEVEKLLSRVTSLSEERDQLLDTLEGLRQEKQQLRAELEDRMETVDQLEKELQICRARQALAEAEADSSQQLLSETNTTVSALREQLSSLDHSTSGVKDTGSSRLQDSAEKLQESFRKFQQFEDTCSKYRCTLLDKVRTVRPPMKRSYLPILPKPTLKVYNAVSYLGQQTVDNLESIVEHLQMRARSYKILFEELVKKDLAVFEERRLQDVLLCRVQAPSYSVKDEDFHTLWEPRLTELLDKRQLYLQQMAIILEKLWASMASCPSELSAEVRDKERFTEQMQAVFANQPTSFSELHRILSCEQDHRSTVAHSRAMTLQAIFDEQNGLCKEVMLLDSQAYSQLSSERSKSSTLLQALEGAPLKTELSLLKDNQQLVLQLQQTEDKVKALCAQIEQLEDAQIKATNTVSNHKEAMQLLQTELQDSRAQVEDKENTIQTLNRRLHQSERNSSPSAVELEKLRVKLFEKDVELNSASAKHKQEIQRMTTLLNEKEESLRKLKETLRKSQQQGEESFLQGEDLHARLTNPRGLIKSSILLEKTKLEEEVKQLQVKISQLESSVSSQQAEISKWKNRAIRMKGKSTAEVDRPSSPCTPTKRGLPMASDSSNVFCSPKKFLVTPKKVLDSPRKVLDSPRKLLDSPKSSFFDVGGSSELLSRSCPRQFFDNSSLGTIPEVSQVPDTPDAEKDADRKEEWWPKSPNGEEMCKTQ
ncbi:centromere-associated protein E [Micropterus dolomieu]|uniref:centromere-associated protein E n=1 Tax=Micropterus dolomieu TaxID=147949 RepID=UPI001E8D6773|nr:centromere-associated protein E [Micropterus dolomieu]